MSRAEGGPREGIVMLAQYFWPETIGSAPYCTDLAVWLAERGWKVTVMTSRPHYPHAHLYPEWQDGSRDQESHKGVSIIRIPTSGRMGSGFLGRIANDVLFAARAMRLAWRIDPANTRAVFVFVPSVLSLLPAKVLGSRAGAAITAVIHDVESGLAEALGIARLKPLVFAMRRVERMALAVATQIVVLSEAMRREIDGLGVKREIHVLPLWSDVVGEIDAGRRGQFALMYSGNFGKKQNLDQLMPLISMISRQMPGIRVLLQGDGSERQRIAAEIAVRGLTNVEFRDLVPAEQLLDSLRSGDVHLVPQALNVAPYAIPSKVFSIMAAGRPFIAIAEARSSLRALASESGGGLAVNPGDPDALGAAVEALTGDDELRRQMGRRGRSYVLRNMTRDKILASYARIALHGCAERA